jgi:predicted lipoprotein with Yx(FWY)xxD motif
MKKLKKTAVVLTGAFVLAALSAMAGDNPEVKTATKQGLGTYLVDDAGKTLYWFTKDSPGTSACAGPCVEKWPLFDCANPEVGPGLTAAEFKTITREDGKNQSTFRGYPLYYWMGDDAAGDTNGQGINGVWFVIDPGNFPPKK